MTFNAKIHTATRNILNLNCLHQVISNKTLAKKVAREIESRISSLIVVYFSQFLSSTRQIVKSLKIILIHLRTKKHKPVLFRCCILRLLIKCNWIMKRSKGRICLEDQRSTGTKLITLKIWRHSKPIFLKRSENYLPRIHVPHRRNTWSLQT